MFAIGDAMRMCLRWKHLMVLSWVALGIQAGAQPVFLEGENPAPEGQVWQPVQELSDDFNVDALDGAKWQEEATGNDWFWRGRPPGLFDAEAVSVADGSMNVTVSKLPEPRSLEAPWGIEHFTHQGAIVRSIYPGHVGWYYECRMKANATVMSSTFWLISKDRVMRMLELDIQECVGRTTEQTAEWGKDWDQIFHSNAFHRSTDFNPNQIQVSGQASMPTKNHENFHVYGFWWKSPSELHFYLDGKYMYSIDPPTPWDMPQYLQMAIELYDWNPLPEDGGLVESGSWEQRTTKYDWIRVWKLGPSAPALGSE